jgi:hypothetical protein
MVVVMTPLMKILLQVVLIDTAREMAVAADKLAERMVQEAELLEVVVALVEVAVAMVEMAVVVAKAEVVVVANAARDQDLVVLQTIWMMSMMVVMTPLMKILLQVVLIDTAREMAVAADKVAERMVQEAELVEVVVALVEVAVAVVVMAEAVAKAEVVVLANEARDQDFVVAVVV